MNENKEYTSYDAETQKAEYMNTMEKSAFAQYVTAGAVVQVNEPKRRVDIKEFRRTYDGDGFQKKIFILSVIGYIAVAFNAMISVLFNIIGLVDCGILGALVFGIHKNKSKGCAIGLLAYALINWVVVFLASGNLLTGWSWFAISIISLLLFNKADKAYAQMYK